MNPYVNSPDPISSFIAAIIQNPFMGFIVILGVLVLVILVIREIVCWYWKINEGLGALYDIKKELMILNKQMEHSERKDQSVSTSPSAHPIATSGSRGSSVNQ